MSLHEEHTRRSLCSMSQSSKRENHRYSKIYIPCTKNVYTFSRSPSVFVWRTLLVRYFPLPPFLKRTSRVPRALSFPSSIYQVPRGCGPSEPRQAAITGHHYLVSVGRWARKGRLGGLLCGERKGLRAEQGRSAQTKVMFIFTTFLLKLTERLYHLSMGNLSLVLEYCSPALSLKLTFSFNSYLLNLP